MDHVTRAASPAEIAAASAPTSAARQILPDGYEAERVIPFQIPIEFAGQIFRSATVRRLRGGDYRKFKTLIGDEDAGVLVLLTGLPAPVIHALDCDDFEALGEASQDFLPRSFRAALEQTLANGPPSPQPSPDTSTSHEAS